MKMKYYIAICVVTMALFTSCASKQATPERPVTDTFQIVHYNVIIAPDFSNRLNSKLYPKPVNDMEIVQDVLGRIYPDILNDKRSDNQQDAFSVTMINKGLISLYDIDMSRMTIDFSRFDKQLDRIHFIKDKSEEKFSVAKAEFLQEYKRVAQASIADTHGADLWSFFNSGLSDLNVKTKSEYKSFNGRTYEHKFRNILIMLTDGYIEASLYGEDACLSKGQCYYLSSQSIKDFRKAFKKSGIGDMKQFFEEEEYGIIPVKNPVLKDVEVLVMEMYDRSLSPAGNATVHPTDEEILQLFWSHWLEKSGVKKYELHKTVNSTREVNQVISSFLGIEKSAS